MKIVTAIDSFKGSMTSMEAGRAVAEGNPQGQMRGRSTRKTAGRWW